MYKNKRHGGTSEYRWREGKKLELAGEIDVLA